MRLVREALETLTLPDAVMGVTLRVESVVGTQSARIFRRCRSLSENHTIETLATTRCADQSLTERVRLRDARRCFQRNKIH